MLAWVADIKELTEKRGEERNEFVRRTHARSMSGNSMRPASIVSSEGGMEDDEADRVAFSGEQSVRGNSVPDGAAIAGVAGAGGLGVAAAMHDTDDARSEAGWRPPQQRPAPGGRFPSDLNVQRGLAAPLSPSSGEDSDRDRDVIAAASALPGTGVPFADTPDRHTDLQPEMHEVTAPAPPQNAANQYTEGRHPNLFPNQPILGHPNDGSSQYGEWMAPIAAGAGGAALGAGVMHHYGKEQEDRDRDRTPIAVQRTGGETAIPQYGESSAPMLVATAAPIDAPTQPRAMSEATTAPSSAAANSTTDAGTLSTVPTSTSIPAADHHANGVFTKPAAPASFPGLAERSQSHVTISDLHVPGEFPATPALQDESRLNLAHN
jgi:hypothetical protein